jgi:hypothetical protein
VPVLPSDADAIAVTVGGGGLQECRRLGLRVGAHVAAPDIPGSSASLTAEERRWLHDKYERLAGEEGNLLAGRTSYFATICAVLITGLVFALANLQNELPLLAISVTFLAAIGVMLSVTWEVLTRRTTGAQMLWRQAALQLEDEAAPLTGTLPAAVTLRKGGKIDVDLLRPYHAHRARFDTRNGGSWMERVNPATVSEVLPIGFIAIWSVVLAVVWVWFLAYP